MRGAGPHSDNCGLSRISFVIEGADYPLNFKGECVMASGAEMSGHLSPPSLLLLQQTLVLQPPKPPPPVEAACI